MNTERGNVWNELLIGPLQVCIYAAEKVLSKILGPPFCSDPPPAGIRGLFLRFLFVHLSKWFFANFQKKSKNTFSAQHLAFPIRFLRFCTSQSIFGNFASNFFGDGGIYWGGWSAWILIFWLTSSKGLIYPSQRLISFIKSCLDISIQTIY